MFRSLLFLLVLLLASSCAKSEPECACLEMKAEIAKLKEDLPKANAAAHVTQQERDRSTQCQRNFEILKEEFQKFHDLPPLSK